MLVRTKLKHLAQYGVELDVPAATILSIFGFRAQVRDQLGHIFEHGSHGVTLGILVAGYHHSGGDVRVIHRCELRVFASVR